MIRFVYLRIFFKEIIYVGVVQEMCAIFSKVVGHNIYHTPQNVGSEDKEKKKWTISTEEVDKETMEKICDIVAPDYCIFGFSYHEACDGARIDKICHDMRDEYFKESTGYQDPT